MKILVRNLNRNVTEAQIQTLFESYGEVESCTLILDKVTNKSKGFSFVSMTKPREAKTAIKELNGKEVSGQKIRVKKAEDPKKEKHQES